MKIETGKYQIELSEESNYKKDSTGNKFKFENLYFNEEEYEFGTQIGIKVYEKDNLISSAIICANGGASGIHENSQIVNKDKIVICCSDQIFNLSIPNLKLNWNTKADSATCFEIFQINNDFIIHGELEISRLSKDGKIIWQKSGADIFTKLESKKDDFKLTDKYIFATDWGNRKYQFDFDGNEIEK